MVQLQSFLRALVGGRVRRINRIVFEHQGVVDWDDGALEIAVGDQTFLVDGSADGERLRVQEGAWEDPFSEPISDENREYIVTHGRWRRVDCSHQNPCSEFVDQVIVAAAPLTNENGRLAGVRISVNGRSMWFVVEFDEAHVCWSHPNGFTEGDAFTDDSSFNR